MPAEPETAAIVPDHSNWWSGPAGSSERFGYLLWFSVGLLVIGPDVLAAFGLTLPWSTLSQTIGHLSGPWKVIVLFLILSFGASEERGSIHDAGSGQRVGRRESVRRGYAYVGFATTVLAVACLTVAMRDSSRFVLGDTLYASLGAAFVVIPTTLAYILGMDLPFPTFGRTLMNLDRREPFLARILYNVTRLTKLK